MKRIRLYREGVASVDGRILVDTWWEPGDPLPAWEGMEIE